MRRLLRMAAWIGGGLAALFLAGSVDWRPARPASSPVVLSAARSAACPLRAGAARVAMMPDWAVPLGGFARAAARKTERALDTLFARALVLQACAVRVGLVLVESLYVPEAVSRAVAEKVAPLGLAGLVVIATHTHAGVGGLDDNPAAQRLGAGAFDPRNAALVADRAAAALETAVASLAPASLGAVPFEASELSRGRGGSEGAAPRSWAVLVQGETGPVASLVIHSAHPTVLGPDAEGLSGDWPGEAMRALERVPGGVALVAQGASGDRTHTAPAGSRVAAVRAFGERVAARAREALAGVEGAAEVPLGFARVQWVLPPAEAHAAPRWLRPLASNLLSLVAPGRATAAALDLGPVVLLAVPGEPVAAIGARLEAVAHGPAAVLALADAYVGYAEEPGALARGAGEAARQYFAADLGERLVAAARVAAEGALSGGGGEAAR